ncbi:MAG: DUF1800 domain-containing protein [Janthinobacterium lividum]
MKSTSKWFYVLSVLFSGSLLLSSFFYLSENVKSSFDLPYKKAHLTEREAAAHLLSRFTYGATPGQIDEVVKIGLKNWFNQQLNSQLPDDSLNQMLGKYDALNLSNEEVTHLFPKPGQVLRMAVQDGVVNKDSVKTDRPAYKALLQNYMQQKGFKPEQELFRQFINQNVLRAAYTNNQLQEVMTDFWFNHFNVSISKNDCALFIPAYERDVIRPNALGNFTDLLLATAKSPAMLYYLDNFSSAASNDQQGNLHARMRPMQNQMNPDTSIRAMQVNNPPKAKKMQGLNENYAREVMELHTLGVDGGYTQQDVTNAAKVLTGWTIFPMGNNFQAIKRVDNYQDKPGFVHEGDFLFTPNRHDKTEKTVLEKSFGPNGGYQEGVDLLTMLAQKTATAKFISRKIAVRFVSDNPPQSLIDKMAATFLKKNGDIKQVLLTMVSAPEFWNAAAIRQKTKSPFELTISAVRSLQANIQQPYQLFNWISKMGEKKYYYLAPTGFPDKGQYWINTGALLNRMNFGLALAAGRIPGVSVDLIALNHHHEPESAQNALITYSKLILPERNLDQTIKRLTPMLSDPELVKKVEIASQKTVPADANMTSNPQQAQQNMVPVNKKNPAGTNSAMLAQVVGVIIGSPEFQRR